MAAGSHRILLERGKAGERPALNLDLGARRRMRRVTNLCSRALSRRPVSNSAMTIVRASGMGSRHLRDRRRARRALVPVLPGSSAAAAWIAWGAQYRRSPTAFYLLLTIVSAGLALGGRYGLWQFVYWLPGFNFIRGSSRFMVLGLLGVAVLAGVGFDRLTARLGALASAPGLPVVGGLLVAEFSALPFKGVPYRLDIPAADLWVARQPKPFSIAEVPVTTSERYHSNYMLHSMAHWQKTVHGFSGIRPALHEELYDQLRTFPSEDSVRHLAQLDVTYVIVHSSWFPRKNDAWSKNVCLAFGSSLRLEYMDPDSRVYSIHHASKKES